MTDDSFEDPHPIFTFKRESSESFRHQKSVMATTAFDKMIKSFADVEIINDQIDAMGFLDATESLVVILESLGSAFGPVKSDILGNVKVIDINDSRK